MRPVSRHTKATSIDSTPRPLSSQSGVSATVEKSAVGWSPSTTRSTGFNIDDYVSSDDDSFTTKTRPTGEDEEELLFKGSFGATGAALPGLLESPLRASAPRVVGFRGSSQPMSPSDFSERGGEGDDGAAEGPDIDDTRRQRKQLSPFTQLRHNPGRPERSSVRTIGMQSIRPRAQSNMVPSWLPSNDWVRPDSRRDQTKRPATSHASTGNMSMYEKDLRPPYRGQIRLSALGGLPSPVFNDTASSTTVKRTNSREELRTGMIREEIDPTIVMRLRKEAKTRKRENETRTIRERRMTRTFGRLDQDRLAALQQAQVQEEMEERGRTRVRVLKGKSVDSG